jgi:hypothetical protein
VARKPRLPVPPIGALGHIPDDPPVTFSGSVLRVRAFIVGLLTAQPPNRFHVAALQGRAAINALCDRIVAKQEPLPNLEEFKTLADFLAGRFKLKPGQRPNDSRPREKEWSEYQRAWLRGFMKQMRSHPMSGGIRAIANDKRVAGTTFTRVWPRCWENSTKTNRIGL